MTSREELAQEILQKTYEYTDEHMTLMLEKSGEKWPVYATALKTADIVINSQWLDNHDDYVYSQGIDVGSYDGQYS